MEYLYCFENASLTLRAINYLYGKPQLPIVYVTVIHQMDGWLVKVKTSSPLNSEQNGELRAFLNELGIQEEPSRRINMALVSLEAGHSAIDIMRRYQVVVVFHGSLKQEEVEVFRQLLMSEC